MSTPFPGWEMGAVVGWRGWVQYLVYRTSERVEGTEGQDHEYHGGTLVPRNFTMVDRSGHHPIS